MKRSVIFVVDDEGYSGSFSTIIVTSKVTTCNKSKCYKLKEVLILLPIGIIEISAYSMSKILKFMNLASVL